jgi:heptosyltransferase III
MMNDYSVPFLLRILVTNSRGKILVIRGGAIGDFVLSLPVFSALRQQFPDTHLGVLGYPHISQMALAGGLVDEVRAIEARALASFFARNGPLDHDFSMFFESFAVIISYLYDPDGIFRENIARCSKAQFIVGPHRPDEGESIHATEVFLKPLERLAIYNEDSIPRLKLVSSGSTQLPHGNWLALHPGSGSESKNWPEVRWAALIHHLVAQTDLKLLLVGGEAEGDRLHRLSSTIEPTRFQLALHWPLSELAQRLTKCVGFVGHDSGISHLAGAVGLTSLILWGATNEVIWRPRNAKVTILRSPQGLGHLSVQKVIERIHELFAKSFS